MPLRITYKPGVRQSHVAAAYFQDCIEGLVESVIDGLEVQDHPILGDADTSLNLRVWSSAPLLEHELNELFEWLLYLRADLHGVQEAPDDTDGLAAKVVDWLQVRLGGADLFVELSIVANTGGDQQEVQLEFVLGVVRGRSVVISTDSLLFTWLDQDIFGLALAGHGSYLMEVVAEEEQRALRRAS